MDKSKMKNRKELLGWADNIKKSINITQQKMKEVDWQQDIKYLENRSKALKTIVYQPVRDAMILNMNWIKAKYPVQLKNYEIPEK